MTSQQYVAQSAQFENNSQEMVQRIAENPEVVHAILGVGDEFLEFMMETEVAHSVEDDQLNLFKEKCVKEAGDILWYLAILCRKYNYSMEVDEPSLIANKDQFMSLIYATQSIQSAFKKHLIYGKELDHSSIQFWINTILWHLERILETPIQDIMKRNYEKLSARYGDKYSDEAAINKNENNE